MGGTVHRPTPDIHRTSPGGTGHRPPDIATFGTFAVHSYILPYICHGWHRTFVVHLSYICRHRTFVDTAWFADQKIKQRDKQIKLGMRQREIVLKHREISSEQLAAARKTAAITDKKEIANLPRHAQVCARRTIALAEQGPTVTVKLQAIRIGDLAVCGIPFETLVEIGLELKDRSPMKQTMVIGLANGRYGYLPTPAQHRLGGYETWIGTNKVQKDASDIITKHLLEMLNELR